MFQTLKKANLTILSSAVQIFERLCTHLKFRTPRTGGKAYGIKSIVEEGMNYEPPLKKPMPSIPEPCYLHHLLLCTT